MVRHFTTASLILEGMKSDLEVTRVPELREIAFGGFRNAELRGAGDNP